MFRFPRANVWLNSKTRRHKQPTATTVLSSITFHMNAAWDSDTDASLDLPTYLTANNAQTSDDLLMISLMILIYIFDSTPLPYQCRCRNCLTVWNYFILWTLYFVVSFPMKKLSSWKKLVYFMDIVFCCTCPDKNCSTVWNEYRIRFMDIISYFVLGTRTPLKRVGDGWRQVD